MCVHYAILAIVINPVGRALRLRGNGAAVVSSLAGAVSSFPVAVGTILPPLVDVGAVPAAVGTGAIADGAATDMKAEAVLSSMSPLMKTRISCTGGVEAAGCMTMNIRTPSAMEVSQRVIRKKTAARIQGIKMAFLGNCT